ncbi:PqqD family protein [Terracoccus luteus]|uniref:Coenzyme PQQ synthesis protein D (PqqD) n=1 Tax=Terracoccus luteus TaxID=53356 RepID=A0A839PWR7_9MICO|nr:PqqD family protein [Terracoccus luteus]MBB2988530.1 hypothetical protein [Terracoccus luteus]MCP2174180.1 hypothetical protein [Terracoccus luteus]
MILALADGVSFRQTNTGLVMLFNRVSGIMYELNETAAEIAKIVADGATRLDELVDRMCVAFDGDSALIGEDTRRFVSDFIKLGIVTAREGED